MTTKDASFGNLKTNWGENKEKGPGALFGGTLGNLVESAQGVAAKISGTLSAMDNIVANILR